MIDNIQKFAESVISEQKVPAVSIAVWKNDELHTGAAGILNLDTGVRATTDSIFQIGSVTKVLTACLVMKLVEDGRVDLDTPVKDYIRGFEVADYGAIEQITVRHLLNHTSGIAGDYFPDDSKLDGPHIARYVDRCSQLPLVHPVGEGFSYSNAAYAIAGRLVEVVAGISWFDAVEEWIYKPLGMKHAICRPEEVIRFRTALGHVSNEKDGENPWKAGTGTYFTMGQAPAGTTPTMTAADLVTFGRAHLDNGLARNGKVWLSPKSIQLMQEKTVDTPRFLAGLASSLGLGWFLYDHKRSGRSFVDHGGATNGQCAMLRLFPDQNAAFAVLMNASSGPPLSDVVKTLTEVVGEVDVKSDAFEVVPLSTASMQKYVGRFRAYAGIWTIKVDGDKLLAEFRDIVDDEPARNYQIRPIGEDAFEMLNDEKKPSGVMSFLAPDQKGVFQQINAGVRLYQRISA